MYLSHDRVCQYALHVRILHGSLSSLLHVLLAGLPSAHLHGSGKLSASLGMQNKNPFPPVLRLLAASCSMMSAVLCNAPLRLLCYSFPTQLTKLVHWCNICKGDL